MTENSPIPGLNVLLIGATGTGKTHSLVTLVEAGITPHILFTEPGMSTIGKALKDKGLPENSVKWHYVKPATQDFASMIEMSKNLNRMSFKLITEMTDPAKGQYLQWIEVLRQCENFTDDRTGEECGNVCEWGTDRALIFDSLSGLNVMSMALIVGGRPTRALPDWLIAQNNLLNFLNKIATDTHCHFVMTGHIEREQDDITGGVQLMPSTLGKSLAPKVPLNFDEVIMTKRLPDKFVWSNNEANAALKYRVLPSSNELAPDFAAAIGGWQAAGGVISSEAPA